MRASAQPHDIVILSNGPGEMLTWVRPMIRTLRRSLPSARITILLSPCPHASGQEYTMATSILKADRALAPKQFLRFLILGQTPEPWDWHARGVVLFLGGDQCFAWMIAKRLGYTSLIYAENACRWLTLNDVFLCKEASVTSRTLWAKNKRKRQVVGDLIQDAITQNQAPLQHQWQPLLTPQKKQHQIALLPGSKPIKLRFMIPYCLALVEAWQRPNTSFVLFLAPNLSIEQLESYLNQNPFEEQIQLGPVRLHKKEEEAMLITADGKTIALHQAQGAYTQMAASDLAITTVGTATDELSRLGVPMIVMSPIMLFHAGLADHITQADGLLGLIARTPVIGRFILRLLHSRMVKKDKLMAWPNIRCQKEVVPEIREFLTPQACAQRIADIISNPKTLARLRDNLKPLKGKPGAADRILQQIQAQLEKPIKPD